MLSTAGFKDEHCNLPWAKVQWICFRSCNTSTKNKSAWNFLQSHKLAFSMLCTAGLNNEHCILPWAMVQCICSGSHSDSMNSTSAWEYLWSHKLAFSMLCTAGLKNQHYTFCLKQWFSLSVSGQTTPVWVASLHNSIFSHTSCFQHNNRSRVEYLALQSASKMVQCICFGSDIASMNSKSAWEYLQSHKLALSMLSTAELYSALYFALSNGSVLLFWVRQCLYEQQVCMRVPPVTQACCQHA